jgi:hypothetical protein
MIHKMLMQTPFRSQPGYPGRGNGNHSLRPILGG